MNIFFLLQKQDVGEGFLNMFIATSSDFDLHFILFSNLYTVAQTLPDTVTSSFQAASVDKTFPLAMRSSNCGPVGDDGFAAVSAAFNFRSLVFFLRENLEQLPRCVGGELIRWFIRQKC